VRFFVSPPPPMQRFTKVYVRLGKILNEVQKQLREARLLLYHFFKKLFHHNCTYCERLKLIACM